MVNRLFVYMYGWEVERAWPALRSREHYTSSCTFYNTAFINCVITSTCLCRLPVDLVPHQPSAGDPFFAAVKDTTTKHTRTSSCFQTKPPAKGKVSLIVMRYCFRLCGDTHARAAAWRAQLACHARRPRARRA